MAAICCSVFDSPNILIIKIHYNTIESAKEDMRSSRSKRLAARTARRDKADKKQLAVTAQIRAQKDAALAEIDLLRQQVSAQTSAAEIATTTITSLKEELSASSSIILQQREANIALQRKRNITLAELKQQRQTDEKANAELLQVLTAKTQHLQHWETELVRWRNEAVRWTRKTIADEKSKFEAERTQLIQRIESLSNAAMSSAAMFTEASTDLKRTQKQLTNYAHALKRAQEESKELRTLKESVDAELELARTKIRSFKQPVAPPQDAAQTQSIATKFHRHVKLVVLNRMRECPTLILKEGTLLSRLDDQVVAEFQESTSTTPNDFGRAMKSCSVKYIIMYNYMLIKLHSSSCTLTAARRQLKQYSTVIGRLRSEMQDLKLRLSDEAKRQVVVDDIKFEDGLVPMTPYMSTCVSDEEQQRRLTQFDGSWKSLHVCERCTEVWPSMEALNEHVRTSDCGR